MTEKRADYRKKQQQKKIRKIFDNFKRLKKDDQSVDAVDSESTVKESSNFESREDFSSEEEHENRINRLKKRLELCNFNCCCFTNHSFVRFI